MLHHSCWLLRFSLFKLIAPFTGLPGTSWKCLTCFWSVLPLLRFDYFSRKSVRTIFHVKKHIKHPAYWSDVRFWGDSLARWINEAGMTARFKAALEAAFAFSSAKGINKKQAKDKLNERLSAFSFVPAVMLSSDRGWFVGWRDSPLPLKTFRETLEVRGSGDAESCRWLVQLIEHGELWSLRPCSCGKWFFARRKDQVSCSTACRKAKYERTPAYRNKRSARRRQNYAREREQDKQNRRGWRDLL